MAIVSGKLIFDYERAAVDSSALPGIADVPIVIQNINTGAMLAVLTDTDGNYIINNVPDGDYQIVEYYGIIPAVPSPGDFNDAANGGILSGGVVPPLSYAPAAFVPAGATHLDCVTPNTLLITVAASDLSSQNILNGPVRYTPVTGIMDSHAVVLPENILEEAEGGTFGSWPTGTPHTTTETVNPYPGVGTGFVYTSSSWPSDGEFTIMNIDNYGYASWWNFADHTTGNETGRMMVINGYAPGANIYEETVTVKPNTYYLFTTWILNAIKTAGLADPALAVQVLDQNGQTILDETLGQLIPVNTNTPEWVEVGSVLYSGSNTTLTFKFISMGTEADGNDYVIDDIGLYEVSMEPPLKPLKTCSVPKAALGDIVTYTVALTNVYDRAITNVVFQDIMPVGLSFIPGSVTVDGVSQPSANPNIGFALPNVPGGETVTVVFSVEVIRVPQINPTLNTAKITFDYTIVEGGIPSPYETESNAVPLTIKKPKICSCSPAGKCRRNIAGHKIWVDDESISGSRPDSIEIILLRDDEVYKRKTIDVKSGWTFRFCCLPKESPSGHEYKYTIDETDVPGYSKAIEGFTVTNTLIP